MNQISPPRARLKKIRGNEEVAKEEIDQVIASKQDTTDKQEDDQGHFKAVLTDPTFRRPFLTALALRILGLDWSGFFNLGTNLVHIKQQACEYGRMEGTMRIGDRGGETEIE